MCMKKRVYTITACLLLSGCASYWEGVSRSYTRHVDGQRYNCASHLVLCFYDENGNVTQALPVKGSREVYRIYDEDGNYKGKMVK